MPCYKPWCNFTSRFDQKSSSLAENFGFQNTGSQKEKYVFQVIADLIIKDFLDVDFSTTGTNSVPWVELLVCEGSYLDLIFTYRAFKLLNFPYLQICVIEYELPGA